MFRKNFSSFVLLGALALPAAVALGMGSHPPEDEEAINARIQPLAHIAFAAAKPAAAQSGAAVGSRSGEELFNTVCIVCHGAAAAPVPNVPKVGNKAAWAPRIALGLDGLVKSATAGKNAMPPKGGSDATPQELARAIAYMANQSGANFKAP